MDPAEAQIFLSEILAGRYRPESLVGHGSFCGTFLAADDVAQEEVAAKILRIGHCGSTGAVEEFRGEVELLQRLATASHVVNIIDSGSHTVSLKHPSSGQTIPVTTEFAILDLAVGSLAQLIMGGRAFGWVDRLSLYRDVVKGVHQMHLQKIVHRDVKADNSLIFDGPVHAEIADLGRAHDTREAPRFAFDEYLAGRGDLRFAPLEFLWLQGTQDPNDQAFADIYLLGSLLFEVATGVGLTSIVAPRPADVLNQNVALPEDLRVQEWEARIPWLREAARGAHETFAAELPPAIRQRATALLAQLTDPDPQRRLPNFSGGRRRATAWDLQWLLERIDGMRRAVDPSYRKTYLAGRRRPRARAPKS